MKFSISLLAIAVSGCAVEAPSDSPSDSSSVDAPSTSEAAQAISGVSIAKQAFERGLWLAELDRSYQASHAGFAAAFEALATSDAVYIGPDAPIVRGAAAIKAALDAADPTHAQRATFDPRRITVSADGTLGATLGWNTFTTKAADGTTTTSTGAYTTVWRFTAGRWREAAHVQNVLAIPPAPQPAGFPLFDPTAPVLALASPADNAAEVRAADLAFAAACAVESSATVVPALAGFQPVEVIYGGMFFGADQDAAAHAVDPPVDVAILAFAPSDAVSTFSGDLGYTDGDYTVPLTGSGTVVARGSYLTIYQRQADGSFRWILTDSNPRPVSVP
jgi:ketosteroid isomerase-like protein